MGTTSERGKAEKNIKNATLSDNKYDAATAAEQERNKTMRQIIR